MEGLIFRGAYIRGGGGRFNGGFFALPVWGAYVWRGLYMKELIFGILRYLLTHPHRGTRSEVRLMEPLPRVYNIMNYFETILPSVKSL